MRKRSLPPALVGTFAFTGALRLCHSYSSTKKGRKTMKRTLIAIASVGVLIPTAWVVEANAQQMSPASPPSQAYAPSQMAPTQAYAQQRRVRRSARYARRGAPRPNGGV